MKVMEGGGGDKQDIQCKYRYSDICSTCSKLGVKMQVVWTDCGYDVLHVRLLLGR